MSGIYRFFKIPEKLRSIVEVIYQFIEWVISLSLITVGIMWLTPAKDFIENNIFPKDQDHIRLLISGAGIVLGVVVGIVHRVGKKSDDLMKHLDDLKKDIDKNVLHIGTNGIYKDVDEEIKNRISKGDNVEITVLAYTLYSIAPKFLEWKSANQLHHLTFNLYHLEENFIKNNPCFEESWYDQLRSYLTSINQFKVKHAEYLRTNKVTINLIPYAHIPAVHGFKLGKGSFYVSFASWNENYQFSTPHNATYEKVEIGDTSEHAKHLRSIFNNWIEAANRSMQQISK